MPPSPVFRTSAIALAGKNHQLHLVPVESQDLQTLSTLAQKIYQQHFTYLWEDGSLWYRQMALSVEQLGKEVQEENTQWYLVYWQGEAIGFLLTRDQKSPEGKDQDWYKLERIYLLEKAKGEGIGQALMDFALQDAQKQGRKKIWLDVMDSSHAAMAFYQKNGFEIFAEHRLDYPLVVEKYKGMYRMKRTL